MKRCPQCGSHKLEITLKHYPKDVEEAEKYEAKENETAKCGNCDWQGKASKLIERKK